MNRQEVIASLDVGGTTISAGIVSTRGKILFQRSVPTYDLGRSDCVLLHIMYIAREMALKARERGFTLLGVGLGLPGSVNVDTGTIGYDIQNIPELACFPLGVILNNYCEATTVLDNDVNALALGELYFGQARGVRNLVFISLGTGVGGGIVLNGEIHRGVNWYGGELGHMTLNPNGRPCFCGSRGCLKTYVSGPDVVAQVKERLGEKAAPLLLNLCGNDPTRIDAEQIFAAAEAHDPLCQELLGELVQNLGAAVGNVINFLNPEMILLGGSLLNGNGKYLNSIREWARRYAFREAFEATRILYASLDKNTSILGAAALFYHERLRWRGKWDRI